MPPGRVVVLADDEVPSRLLLPLDKVAAEALRKAKEAYAEDLAFRREQIGKPLSLREHEELLRVPKVPAQLPADAHPAIDMRPRSAGRKNRASDVR